MLGFTLDDLIYLIFCISWTGIGLAFICLMVYVIWKIFAKKKEKFGKFKGYLYKVTYRVRYGQGWEETYTGTIRAHNKRAAKKICKAMGLTLHE